MHASVRTVLIVAALLGPLASRTIAQSAKRAGNPACALLTTAEIRTATGIKYDKGSEGDALGEGVGGGASCQWGGPGMVPGETQPLLSVVLIPRKQQSPTEVALKTKPGAGCQRETLQGVGELAWLETCERSRGPVAHVKAGAYDLLVQMDAMPPATAASVKPGVIAVAKAAAAKAKAS